MRAFLKRFAVSIFQTGQRCGFNLFPNHYYAPMADVNALRRSKEFWAKPSTMPGIRVDLDAQAETLRRIVKPFKDEYKGNKIYLEGVQKSCGPGYGYIEAQALHGFLRSTKPQKIIEVGSGVSTYCMLHAAQLNRRETGVQTEIICVEPYPSDFLKECGVQLNRVMVETLDPSFFDQLGDGDLLFIDSTHSVRPGGDVVYLYLEVLPRLKPGVFVHIHDIYLPYTYNRDVLKTFFQWSETALLLALISGGSSLAIQFCLSMLHYDRKDVLREVFPEYQPQEDQNGLIPEHIPAFTKQNLHFPSSIYLR